MQQQSGLNICEGPELARKKKIKKRKKKGEKVNWNRDNKLELMMLKT